MAEYFDVVKPNDLIVRQTSSAGWSLNQTAADALAIHPIKLRWWCEWSRGIGDIEHVAIEGMELLGKAT
jgi:hypothetical protein